MPFCENCGSELSNEDVFCGNCGAKVIIDETEPIISQEILFSDVKSGGEFDLRKHIDSLIEDGMWISIGRARATA